MKKLLKVTICFVVASVFALTDKVAVVVNDHIITDIMLTEYVDNFAKVSGNVGNEKDAGFRDYVKNLMVTSLLLDDFATQNQLTLTVDEENTAIAQVMAAQGKSVEDFSTVAAESGVDTHWMRQFILGNVLQQKVGMLVIAPKVAIADDAVMVAKQRFLDENTQYKIKAWTIGLDEDGANTEMVKDIKHTWALTSVEPETGETQDLGWKRRSELPTLFLQSLEGVSAGNVVGPIRSEYGYHLVWFEGERIPELPSDQEIHQSLMQEEYTNQYNEWLSALPEHNLVIYK